MARNSLLEDQRIIQHEIHDEMKNSYIDYAMSVIVGRALPDVRDGLKPVHRRILYGMHELGISPDKPHKKSARIVGEVMGKYHPHGDSSIYDAMVKLAQPFATRYPLIDGHGNFGSIDGDGAAAMRYTEARMTPFSLQMIRDIDKNTVDFVPNFDEEETEPKVLPARVPNLLINGSNGIAVGMATSIPPHNLKEVINACVKMIDDNKCTTEDLIKIIKGPDFPTGAQILGKEEIKDAYRTGQGKVQVRAVTKIEEAARGKTQIIVTEIPYQVNKAKLLEKIADLVKEKKIDGISAVRDESNREGIRVVIEVKRGSNPKVVLDNLFKLTPLQDNYSIIMLAIVNGAPKILSLYEMLDEYLKHQKEVVTRRTEYDLKKAEDKAHILEGLIIALDNIDAVIKTIRESYNDAKKQLIRKFGLSEFQAQAILDMRLARLQGLERKKIEAEYKDLCRKIKYYQGLLKSEKKLMNVIKEELLEIRDKWGDKRRTSIITEKAASGKKDLPEKENVIISLSRNGYLKRTPEESFRESKGKDYTVQTVKTDSHGDIKLLTDQGNIYQIKAYEIGDGPKGNLASKLLGLSSKEKVLALISSKTKNITIATKNGTVKKVKPQELKERGGFITLKGKDEIVSVLVTSGKNNMMLLSENGKCISFSENNIPVTGAAAAGVKGMSLETGDKVLCMLILKAKANLITVSENNFIKKTPLSEYKIQARGGKGVLTTDKTKLKKTGKIRFACIAEEKDVVNLPLSDKSIISTAVSEIPVAARASAGNQKKN